jgi:hypothetical protein
MCSCCHLATRHLTNVHSLAGAEIIDIAYGIDVKPRDDPYIKTAEHALESVSAATNPGSYLVDVIPIRQPYLICELYEY